MNCGTCNCCLCLCCACVLLMQNKACQLNRFILSSIAVSVFHTWTQEWHHKTTRLPKYIGRKSLLYEKTYIV